MGGGRSSDRGCIGGDVGRGRAASADTDAGAHTGPGKSAVKNSSSDTGKLAPGDRPEVLRGELRQLLLDSLPAGIIRWGAKVTSARSLGLGSFEVIFDDGATVATALLVGADGAWSRIRPLLSDATPSYTGTCYVETYFYDVDERHPEAGRAVGGGGGGSMLAPAHGKGILAHRPPAWLPNSPGGQGNSPH